MFDVCNDSISIFALCGNIAMGISLYEQVIIPDRLKPKPHSFPSVSKRQKCNALFAQKNLLNQKKECVYNKPWSQTIIIPYMQRELCSMIDSENMRDACEQIVAVESE
jgi:hypothetical protein